MKLEVPSSANARLRRFARSLGAEHCILVQRDPAPNARSGNCWNNAESHVASFGGAIVEGFALRIVKRAFIEAECHVVWEAPNGKLLDISPHMNSEEITMFAMEAKGHFSDQGMCITPNQYVNIGVGSTKRVVEDLIFFSRKKQAYELENKVTTKDGIIFTGNEALLDEFLEGMKRAWGELGRVLQ